MTNLSMSIGPYKHILHNKSMQNGQAYLVGSTNEKHTSFSFL